MLILIAVENDIDVWNVVKVPRYMTRSQSS